MKKKLSIFILLLVSVLAGAQDLNETRLQYPKAAKSIEITTKLDNNLVNVNSSNKPILLAYKGAVLTLKAKFSKSKDEKKKFFKEGVSLIENAINADSSNIEIHYLRLSVQENSPKMLGYHKNIEEDKEFILKNYVNISSDELKSLIRDFVSKSINFSESERGTL